MGGPVKQAQFTVEAESAKSVKANGPALFTTKKAFASKSSDGTSYELKIVEQNQAADVYSVVVSAASKTANDKRFFLVEKSVEVKITTSISVVDVQIGVADRDQSTPRLVKIEQNAQLKDKLDADQQSKFYLKFAIKEKSKGALIEAHQAFVRFTEVKSRKEIVFMAQATNKQYSAEVDFASNAKNFRHTSGAYTVELIISDALIENPISWKLADIKLQFVDDASASAGQDKASLYSKLPEIKHMFRPPEATPPVVVSTVFTILCLVPLVLLVLLVNMKFFVVGFFVCYEFFFWTVMELFLKLICLNFFKELFFNKNFFFNF